MFNELDPIYLQDEKLGVFKVLWVQTPLSAIVMMIDVISN